MESFVERDGVLGEWRKVKDEERGSRSSVSWRRKVKKCIFRRGG